MRCKTAASAPPTWPPSAWDCPPSTGRILLSRTADCPTGPTSSPKCPSFSATTLSQSTLTWRRPSAPSASGAELAPLLIFTRPDNSGVQSSHVEPEPGSPGRLRYVSRLTYRRGERKRTTLDALESIGQEIASGRDPNTGVAKAPQHALADGFNVSRTDAFSTTTKPPMTLPPPQSPTK